MGVIELVKPVRVFGALSHIFTAILREWGARGVISSVLEIYIIWKYILFGNINYLFPFCGMRSKLYLLSCGQFILFLGIIQVIEIQIYV